MTLTPTPEEVFYGRCSECRQEFPENKMKLYKGEFMDQYLCPADYTSLLKQKERA
jgi:hypothetical protein